MNSRNTLIAALAAILAAFGIWLALRSDDGSNEKAVAAASRPTEVAAPSANVTRARAATATGSSIPPAVPVISGQMPPAAQPPRALLASNANGRRDVPATDTSLGGSPAPQRDAMIDLDKVHHMITNYHTLMGENPVGTNAEIMQALMGANRNEATLGPPEGQALNDKGELTDRWGTPYFFHQLSRDTMEIHSAGPDKIMGTADDVIIK